MILEAVGGVSPLWGGGFADGVLLPEEAGFVEGFVEGQGVDPADFDEVFGLFGVVGRFSMIVGLAEDFEAGLGAVCGFDLKVFGGGCGGFDFAYADIAELGDAHPDEIAGVEHRECLAIPTAAACGEETILSRFLPTAA